MKTLKIVLVLFLFIQNTPKQLFAQPTDRERTGSSAVFAELFGPGMSVSINYDFRFNKTNKGMGARIGFGGLKYGDTDFLAIPFGFNYLMGREDKFFEIGINGVYSSSGFYFLGNFLDGDEDDRSKFVGMLTIGFRRQPTTQGFNFRVALNPAFGEVDNEFFFWPIYGGVSFGYTF